jgi:hypothetical protein
VVFPPLAVVMCATMLSVAWRTKLSLGRFLHFAREQGAPQLAEALDRDCKGAVSLVLLRRSIFLIMCFACCFYALFLFDTLGDAVGLRKAYWVLIVMPLFPLVLAAALRARLWYGGLGGNQDEVILSGGIGIEMHALRKLSKVISAATVNSDSASDMNDTDATFNALSASAI